MKSYLLLLFLSLSSLKAISQIDTSEIFTVVEDMPSFPGCEDLPTNDERKKCTETNLLKFYYRNIKLGYLTPEDSCFYSSLAVISFVIDTTGRVTEIKKIKGCEEMMKEVIKVTELMNELPTPWKSGEQHGEKVRVKYTLPLRLCFRQNQD